MRHCLMLALWLLVVTPINAAPIMLEPDATAAHALQVHASSEGHVLQVTGADPYVRFHQHQHTAQTEHVVVLRYRAERPLDAAFYWTQPGADQPIWRNYRMMLPATEIPGTGRLQTQETVIPIGLLSPHWTGTVSNFRIDPTERGETGALVLVSAVLSVQPRVWPCPPAPARAGEYVAPVRQWIDPVRSARGLENGRYLVSTSGASLEIWRREANDWKRFALLSWRIGALDTASYPAEQILVRFHDAWPGSRMQIVCRPYQNGQTRMPHTAAIHVALEPDEPPVFWASGPAEVFLHRSAAARFLATGTAIRRDTPNRISLRTNQRLTVAPTPEACRAALHLTQAQAVQAVSIRQGDTAWQGRVRISTPSGVQERRATLPFRTVCSGDFVDVMAPVGTSRLTVDWPTDLQVLRATDAHSGVPVTYRRTSNGLVFYGQPARILRIKANRMVDWRVMHNTPMPVEPGRYYEDISNYYYPQWMFLWDSYLDEAGRTILNPWPWLNDQMRAHPLPVFVGLHWGNHAPPGQYSKYQKLHPEILQTDSNGTPHTGYGGQWPTPPWMCLVHPELHRDIEQRLDDMIPWMQSQPWWSRVFGFSSTSEPWIVQSEDPDVEFCYNPAHIEWFRTWLKARWSTLERVNATFGTAFRSWDQVTPPVNTPDTAWGREWSLARAESVIDSERWFRGAIRKRAPALPTYAHIAIIIQYNETRNYLTPDVMWAGDYTDPHLVRCGGSLYTNDPTDQALAADPIRSLQTHSACFPECYADRYAGMYTYLVGASGLFTRQFSMMIPGSTWSSGLQLGDAWPVFSEIWRMLAADQGDAPLPKTAIVWDLLSANREAMASVHRVLFAAGVDRCVVSTRQIEHGLLTQRRFAHIILPEVRFLTTPAIEAIERARQHGTHVIRTGDTEPPQDPVLSVNAELRQQREATWGNWDHMDLSQLVRTLGFPDTNKMTGLYLYRKQNGLTALNAGEARSVTIDRITGTGPVCVIGDTGQVREIRRTARAVTVWMQPLQAVVVKRTRCH